MSKPTAEQIFKSHYPRATIERHKRERFSSSPAYYLVRDTADAQMWSGQGSTKAQAWRDACERLQLTAIKEPTR